MHYAKLFQHNYLTPSNNDQMHVHKDIVYSSFEFNFFGIKETGDIKDNTNAT